MARLVVHTLQLSVTTTTTATTTAARLVVHALQLAAALGSVDDAVEGVVGPLDIVPDLLACAVSGKWRAVSGEQVVTSSSVKAVVSSQ